MGTEELYNAVMYFFSITAMASYLLKGIDYKYDLLVRVLL